MLQSKPQILPQHIFNKIKTLREKKGREKEALNLIDKGLGYSHDFMVNLFWEKALTYQHLYMNNSKNRKMLSLMQKNVLDAEFYINKFKLIKWKSRVFRFLGRVADYKGKYSEACKYYKKSLNFIKKDPEPFRVLEIKGFLATSLIMDGKFNQGLNLVKKGINSFDNENLGVSLKRNDYNMWLIWKSGLIIRTVDSLLEKKQFFDRKLIFEWIDDIEKDIKKGDFGYRTKELTILKQRLSD